MREHRAAHVQGIQRRTTNSRGFTLEDPFADQFDRYATVMASPPSFVFIIEDEIHAETQEGEYATFEEAVAELQRRASLPWDVPPNRPPCMSWRTCERRYIIIDLESLHRIPFLRLCADETNWLQSDDPQNS
jgi:hypothetical protein